MPDVPVVIFCDHCGTGINLAAKERVWKCGKCSSQVCANCYSTSDTICRRCAEPIHARKSAEATKRMEEDRNTWRHFILGMYSNMELDQPFRERLAAGILDLLRLKPVVEDRPLDGVLSAWVTSQDYVKTLHILCFIVTANAVVVAGAQQYRMKGDVSVHTPNVISRKEISTAAFTPGKGGLLGHGALIELSVGSKAQQFSFSQDRKTRDEVNSKVRRTCSLLGG